MAKKQNEFALEFEKPIKDLKDKIEEMKVYSKLVTKLKRMKFLY